MLMVTSKESMPQKGLVETLRHKLNLLSTIGISSREPQFCALGLSRD